MTEGPRRVAVWDIPVRIFHWVLVGSVIGMYITGDDHRLLHTWLGYLMIGIVLARIAWGFFGSEYARFKNFLYSPKTIFQYLLSLLKNNPKHYVGHNPAGGFMIIVMLFTLLLTGFAGLKTLGQKGHGPLAHSEFHSLRTAHADDDEHDDDGHHADRRFRPDKKDDEWWEDMHEFLTGVMIFLIIVHISGVIVSSWLHKENLILAMITGKKGSFRYRPKAQ